MIPIEVTAELGEPVERVWGSPADARKFTLFFGGVEVFTEYVWDTDQDGNRTEEQALKNGLRVFSNALRRLMQDVS